MGRDQGDPPSTALRSSSCGASGGFWVHAWTLVGGPADSGKPEGEAGVCAVDTALGPLCSLGDGAAAAGGIFSSACLLGPESPVGRPQGPGASRLHAEGALLHLHLQKERRRSTGWLCPSSHPWASAGFTVTCPAWTARLAPYETHRRQRPTPRASPSSQTDQQFQQQMPVRLGRNLSRKYRLSAVSIIGPK